MHKLLFQKRIRPSLKAAQQIRHDLNSLLHSAVANMALQQRIQLLVAESLSNLITHARPQPTRIEVMFSQDLQHWWLDIRDNGAAWNPLTHQSGSDLDSFELQESGRGVHLLKSQSDEISYHTQDAVNHLRIGWKQPTRSARPSILIVDDDSSQTRLIDAYLSDSFTTFSATDGQQALSILRDEAIDLVLSDIEMPGMTGLNLRQQLSQLPKQELLPFIFLSGHAQQELITAASRMGVDDYLIKPVKKTDLIQVIQRVLERSEQVKNTLNKRIDQDITQALAVKPPTDNPQWQFAAFSQHTGKGGGDFLLHRNKGDSIQLVLSDTMGHDDSAKFFSHAYAGYLRGFMQSTPSLLPPDRLLETFNHAACADQLFSSVTMTCIALNLSNKGQIHIASAGHPAAILITAEGIRDLECGGMLPGLLPDTDYQSLQHPLGPGEKIALYTDGLFESGNSAEERRFLEQRIRALLHTHRDRSIQQIIQAVEQLFSQLTHSHPQDDVSLLLIEPTHA